MNYKKTAIITLLISMMLVSLGCSRSSDVIEEEETTVITIEEEEEAEESYEGMAINPLTGLWIDEEAAARRPVAIMINNLRVAHPQSGISQADVLYETLAEGNITRLVGVFQDFDAEKIGPYRSARHYYLNFAFDHDAIFVHHGGSPQAFQAIRELQPASLNTLGHLETIMSWRDPERRRQRGMYEHSLYTNAEGIMKGWETAGYRVERREGFESMFTFSQEEWTPVGEKAEAVTAPFSPTYIAKFHYDTATGLYKRYQFDQPHIDELNNQQLTFKNVIVQYTDIKAIPGDTEGRRDVKLIASGEGVYITNGIAIPITWSKADHKTPTIYKDNQGNILKLNRGKTWIGVFPNNRSIEVE
ncbi:MAG: DUF3048 domain-containing protein [Clostridiaceae bacterium]|nr:DUF3048 domain-containing protein [Clostridiaceae bacterium]